MKKKKEKKTKYISEFNNYKKICQLNKHHSPITILFCTDDLPDEWLIDVVEYRTKSGVVVDNYGVNAKTLQDYINFCGKDGFTKITQF